MNIKKLAPYFIGVAVAVVGGGLYKKHEQLESVDKMCMSNNRDRVFCDCVKSEFDALVPFYKATDSYAIIFDGKEEAGNLAKQVASSCGIPRPE